jgi:asparagine synthetase B (glutamine-hydrolysing)
VFFEAIIYYSSEPSTVTWQDHSTAEDFIFESDRGAIKLRKRSDFPQTNAYLQGNTLILGYGNLQHGQKIARRALDGVDESLFHAEEFLYIEINLTKTEVIVQRDTLSTLPVFIGHQNNQLVISSEHSRVIELLDRDELQVDEVALLRYVCGLDFTYATLFKNVIAVHDRMRFNWSKGRSQLQFAPHATIQEVIKLRDGSIRELRGKLETTLETYKERYAPSGALACEWSGGIDSTLVAGYLADQGYNITTASMLLPGPEGLSQAAKLQDFTHRFATVDTITVQLDPEQHYRFQGSYETNTWKPADFREMTALGMAQNEYLRVLQAQGFTSILTGFGGDELCEENNQPHQRLRHDLSDPFRWHDRVPPVWWTPAMQSYLDTAAIAAQQQLQQTLPPVSPSITVQGLRGNNLYINHGIWPAHPLGDPLLYAYCQSLPLRYRINKHLLKMYLEARRTPHSIYRGKNEDFRNFYYTSAVQKTRPLLQMFLANSLLAKAGLIDKIGIMTMHDRIVQQSFSRKNWRELFDIIRILNVEISLQTSGIRSI